MEPSSGSSTKRKIVRRPNSSVVPALAHVPSLPDASDDASEVSSQVSLSTMNTASMVGVAPRGVSRSGSQMVSSAEEGNALVRRLRQLEAEGAALAKTLTKVCDENASLTNQLATSETKIAELSTAPLQMTPVLHSLFEPEKTGWFGGSKNAAREKLEKLAEALQKEFMDYKSSHASSNDEVQALVSGLQAAHQNAAQLSKVVNEQQQAISEGPLKVAVQVVTASGPAGEGGVIVGELQAQLQRRDNRIADLSDQVHRSAADVARLQVELRAAQEAVASAAAAAAAQGAGSPSSAPVTGGSFHQRTSSNNHLQMEVETQKLRDENASLREELQGLRDSLHTEQRLRELKQQECSDLAHKLEEQSRSATASAAAAAATVPAACVACAALRKQLTAAQSEAASAQADLQAAKTQLLDTSARMEKQNAALQAQLVEKQTLLSQKEAIVNRSVSSDQFAELELKNKSLQHDLELSRRRVSKLEELTRTAGTGAPGGAAGAAMAASGSTVDDVTVLAALERNRERVSRLEFDNQQLAEQLAKAQEFAVAREQETQRLERSSNEDKQRIAFLLKKCAAAMAEMRAAAAARDSVQDELTKTTVELKKHQRVAETVPALQQRVDEAAKEKAQLSERLAATAEIEERLVRAKETIAYMELAQSQNINMSQYAELKASKEKLENTMQPLQKKLDEALGEVARLRAVTDAQQMVTGTQQSSVSDMGDRLAAAVASEQALREAKERLTGENARLVSLNDSLEKQMNDMQDGIREMALKMEKDRTGARESAVASSQKEVAELKAQLEAANAKLAGVQAAPGQFVAVGLYKSTVAEKEKVEEEMVKKNYELEKHKSEILIYRQTIQELEGENDEHVKELEALQDRFQVERESLTERLAAEQRRTTELTAQVEELQVQIQQHEGRDAMDTASLKELRETAAKQRRAFEDKCRTEQALVAELSALKSHLADLQSGAPSTSSRAADGTAGAGAVSAITASAATAAAATAAAAVASTASPASALVAAADAIPDEATTKRLYQLQCDGDRLREELRRVQMRARSDADEDRRTIQSLQTQLKSRMAPGDRAAYEQELHTSKVLRQSNEQLLAENEKLRRQAATAGAAAGAGGSMYAASTPVAGAGAGAAAAGQADVVQLQLQLDSARRELEEVKRRAAAAVPDAKLPRPPSEPAAAAAAAADDEDGAASAAAEKPKKKVRKVKKKRTLSEHMDLDGEGDVLGTPPHLSFSGDVDGGDVVARLRLVEMDLASANRELEQLRDENVTLRETVALLQTDLQEAQRDLEEAQEAMDGEREDYQQRIHALEQGGSGRADGAAMASGASLAAMEAENAKLRADLQAALDKAASSGGAAATASAAAMPPDAKKLQRQLNSRAAEVKALTEQLLPTKNKLMEYMALADRLGISYPFPEDFEHATMVRLKAVRGGRAESAPPLQTRGGAAFQQPSPPPRDPNTRRQTRSYREEGEDSLL